MNLSLLLLSLSLLAVISISPVPIALSAEVAGEAAAASKGRVFAVELELQADVEQLSDAELDNLALQGAGDLSLEMIGPVANFRDVYLFREKGVIDSGHPRRMEDRLQSHDKVKWAEKQVLRSRHKRDSEVTLSFADPLYPQQWHLQTLNLLPVWEQGIAGRGVVVSMVDDGIDYNHEDLAPQYLADGSYDWNDNDENPLPRLAEDIHGTRCAGEIVAATNSVCGIGVAYEAKITASRILSAPISDAVEASALSYKNQLNHIYSNSWGPWDDGATVEAPGPLAQRAFREGVAKGRDGRGSIFVFAAGNGGQNDNCNYDGYANSIYTIAIGAVGRDGVYPSYAEPCSAHLAVVPSSNTRDGIFTDNIHDGCTGRHGGTSAAAPLAAGIIALALQVREELTWRDVQWLVIELAEKVDPGIRDWKMNGAGYHVHHMYGFGLLDASLLVEKARNWELVPPQKKITIYSRDPGAEVYFEVDGVITLEHVTVTLSTVSSERGAAEFELISPAGTASLLATRRPRDTTREGLSGWTFVTVHNWGEESAGRWTLRARNAVVTSSSLSLYGF